jgi:hypothetical protein
MKIDLATISFPSQRAAFDFFKHMSWRYGDCDRVNEDDAQHLSALLEWHDERDEKVGIGVDHFAVMWAPEFGTRCFWIIRRDGTQIDFSYRHCIQRAGARR